MRGEREVGGRDGGERVVTGVYMGTRYLALSRGEDTTTGWSNVDGCVERAVAMVPSRALARAL